MDDLIELMKKRGFKDTLTILVGSDSNEMRKSEFYDKLNEISYYNSYLRIKDDLLHYKLIEMETKNGGGRQDEYIRITSKGIYMYQQLTEISTFLTHFDSN